MNRNGALIRHPEVGQRGNLTAAVPRVQVQHVFKAYSTGVWPLARRTVVLKDTSLVVYPGEIVAIVGGNGSGKSTLMKIIAGTLDRDSGSVNIRGRIGYCPQSAVLYEKLTVSEMFRLFGVAYDMSAEEVLTRQADLMEALDFGGYEDYRVEHLSGGTAMKLNLSLALLHQPDVLLLDEPYAGFDYDTYLRFWSMSKELAEGGRSILVITHFVQEKEQFSRVFRIKEGRCEQER